MQTFSSLSHYHIDITCGIRPKIDKATLVWFCLNFLTLTKLRRTSLEHKLGACPGPFELLVKIEQEVFYLGLIN